MTALNKEELAGLDIIPDLTPALQKELADLETDTRTAKPGLFNDRLMALQHLESAYLKKMLAIDDKHPQYDLLNAKRALASYKRYLDKI